MSFAGSPAICVSLTASWPKTAPSYMPLSGHTTALAPLYPRVSRRTPPTGYAAPGGPLPGRHRRERRAGAAQRDSDPGAAAGVDLQRGPGDDAAAGRQQSNRTPQVLDTLRRSAHNTVAIGDAENDHELLRLAEVGARVEWGSPALRAAADIILRGPARRQWPTTFRPSTRGRCRSGTRAAPPSTRHTRGRPRFLARHARAQRADRRRCEVRKSWVAGLLCEQLILHGYCVCVIDPEGDYTRSRGCPV